MPAADQILERWARHPERGQPFVARHEEASRPARTLPFPAAVPEALRAALRSRGVDALYSHQAHAVEAIARGENVVVATPTASGKTLVYNLPTLAACMADPAARALYLFPTKALAHDQVAELDALSAAAEAGIASRLSACIASRVWDRPARRFSVCSTMIAADSRETPV
jgi:DEAD/DEAH box helicase domain-containing protein